MPATGPLARQWVEESKATLETKELQRTTPTATPSLYPTAKLWGLALELSPRQ